MFARRAGFRYSLCTWGPAIQKTQQQLNTVDVSNMFSIYDPTSTNCPRYNDPDLTSYPPGPFCYSCGGGQGTAEDFEGGTATTTTTNNNDEQVNTNDNDNGGESNVPVNDRPSNAGVLRCTKNNHVLFLVLGIVAMVWMF